MYPARGIDGLSDQPIVVCFPFVGDNFGGSHISAIKLIRGLDAGRVRPLVVLHRDDGELAAFLASQSVDFVTLPDVEILAHRSPGRHKTAQWSRAWAYLSNSLPKMRSFLKARGVDVVHTNDGRIHASWALAARLAGARLVWHHRGAPDALGVNMLAPLLAHHIVTVSQFARPARPIVPVRHKLSVVHSPFDHPPKNYDRKLARRALIDELGCSPQTRFLGFFGIFNTRKRPVAFVDAVSAFQRRHPEIPVAGLMFGMEAGDGPPLMPAIRRRAAELDVKDRIHLMGFRQPVEQWMCATDILLVPALNEPFGRTLIEAMMLGTPVVATDHGGNPEAIEHGKTGFLVEPETPEAFVPPIHQLLSDAACWRRISDTARKHAFSCYGLRPHVDRLTEIYESLVRRPGWPRTTDARVAVMSPPAAKRQRQP